MEQNKSGFTKVEKEIDKILSQLIMSSAKRILVFGVDSYKKVGELATNLLVMLYKAKQS